LGAGASIMVAGSRTAPNSAAATAIGCITGAAPAAHRPARDAADATAAAVSSSRGTTAPGNRLYPSAAVAHSAADSAATCVDLESHRYCACTVAHNTSALSVPRAATGAVGVAVTSSRSPSATPASVRVVDGSSGPS